MLVAGAGMYLLLTCITRYVQTPGTAGYGFGLDTFTAGLFLVPFSALGFVAGRISPHLRKRMPAAALLSASTAVVLTAFVLFAAVRGNIASPLLAMSLLGLGVGGFSAAMPAVILQVTPHEETASAMGVNQVVRSTGFSLGSTLSALILAAYTPAGAVFPATSGYATTAWTGTAITALALVITLTLSPQKRTPAAATEPADRQQAVTRDGHRIGELIRIRRQRKFVSRQEFAAMSRNAPALDPDAFRADQDATAEHEAGGPNGR
jgi:predicted MFS family arabinose efflux permease